MPSLLTPGDVKGIEAESTCEIPGGQHGLPLQREHPAAIQVDACCLGRCYRLGYAISDSHVEALPTECDHTWK